MASSMRHASQKLSYLIPPRTMGEITAKAFSGAWSIISSQEKREAYVQLIEKGIIKERIFFGSFIGPVLTLSLVDELDSDLLAETNLEVHGFLQGVGPALEQFHQAEQSLLTVLHKQQQQQDVSSAQEDSSASHSEQEKEEQQQQHQLLMDRTNLTVEEQQIFESLTKYCNDQEADPESFVSRLKKMTSGAFFELVQYYCKVRGALSSSGVVKMEFHDESTIVSDISLLSARVVAEGKVGKSDDEEADYDSIRDDELNVLDDSTRAPKSIVAQLEVLYTMSQDFTVQTQYSLQPAEVRESKVNVGVLEGYLKGGGELRWRLANVREPWEVSTTDVDSGLQFRK